jgi:hypothetical protein
MQIHYLVGFESQRPCRQAGKGFEEALGVGKGGWFESRRSRSGRGFAVESRRTRAMAWKNLNWATA